MLCRCGGDSDTNEWDSPLHECPRLRSWGDNAIYPGTGKDSPNPFIANFPVWPQVTPESWHELALPEMVRRLEAHCPEFVIVAAGFDVHKKVRRPSRRESEGSGGAPATASPGIVRVRAKAGVRLAAAKGVLVAAKRASLGVRTALRASEGFRRASFAGECHDKGKGKRIIEGHDSGGQWPPLNRESG